MIADLMSWVVIGGIFVFAVCTKPRARPRPVGKGAPVYDRSVAVPSVNVSRALRGKANG